MLPFTVARMTIVNLKKESPLLFGMQRNSIPNTLRQCRPHHGVGRTSRYSMTNRFATKSNVLWPILRACVAMYRLPAIRPVETFSWSRQGSQYRSDPAD